MLVALALLTACNRTAPAVDLAPSPTPTIETIAVPTWQPTNSGIPERLPATTTPLPILDAIPQVAAVIVSAPALLPADTPTAVPTLAPATTGGDVVIASIMYNGVVPQVESDEYVTVVNRGTAPVDLSGWTIDAGDGVIFRFPAVTNLLPSGAYTVYTNEYHPESGGFTFGSGDPIWNNQGDTGTLRDAAANVVSVFTYP